MKYFLKVLNILRPKEKKEAGYVLFLVIIMAVLETTSVASLIPFLGLLGNKQLIDTNPFLSNLFSYLNNFGIETHSEFLVFLGAGSFVILITSSAYKIFTHYVMNKFIEMRRHSLSSRLIEAYTYQPYSFFLNRQTADMSKTILSEVDHFTSNVIRSTFTMLSGILLILFLITFIFVVNPIIALSVLFLFIMIYLSAYMLLKRRLKTLGEVRALSNKNRFHTSNELFQGIKVTKVTGFESFYLNKFFNSSESFSSSQAMHLTLTQLPKFIIESIVFGGIISAILFFMTYSQDSENYLGEILPLIGVIVFAMYRIHPASQSIFQGFANLRYGAMAVNSIYQDLLLEDSMEVKLNNISKTTHTKKNIEINDLSFKYHDESYGVLKNISFNIETGSSIGIAGMTGSGKTTLVDLILGLLNPSSGFISIDGEVLKDHNLKAWQKSIGYVPQKIFLHDASIAENIAIGKSLEEINMERVKECAKIADLDIFISKKLSYQYLSRIGEDGINLSGGQRQRLGIARALYHNPSLLIFDEATSALDEITQQNIVESINRNFKNLTTIFIAHRISTLKYCDKIIFLREGQIEAVGDFNELIKTNTKFQEMSQTNK
ncbi:ABC transporter ATP-binding protein/permease [Gammaproteobacteria bacterium]|nr:ABC transporter ATP-binding protein/permease [Gammaproteobacteria bacterium]